jgi:hypothetical protein
MAVDGGVPHYLARRFPVDDKNVDDEGIRSEEPQVFTGGPPRALARKQSALHFGAHGDTLFNHSHLIVIEAIEVIKVIDA